MALDFIDHDADGQSSKNALGPADMDDIIHGTITSIGQHFSRSLPAFVGMWLIGLASYGVVASVVAAVSLRRQESWTLANTLAFVTRRELYRDFSARITWWHFVAYVVFWAPLFALMTFAPTWAAQTIAHGLDGVFGARRVGLDSPALVVFVQCTVIVLAMSFASYLHHYASHRIPILWSFHRAHHSVEALTLPANAREHPFDLLTIQLLMNAFAGLFGGLALHLTGTALHPATFVVVGVGIVTYFGLFGVFNHTHIPISLGWFNRIIMAPVLHQFHHSAEVQHRDTNIGSFWGIMIWDWAFGTLYLPKSGETYRWGLNEHELGSCNPHQRLRDFYLEPFRHAADQYRTLGWRCFLPASHDARDRFVQPA